MSQGLSTAAIREVYDCHVLIETWFHGAEQATPEVLERLLAAFDHGFSMVNPGGKQLGHDGLASFLSGMRGARPEVRIRVSLPEIVLDGPDCCVLRYEEIQELGDQQLHRLSTAVFTAGEEGIARWLHLHETWAAKE
jgi:hypothetical protein